MADEQTAQIQFTCDLWLKSARVLNLLKAIVLPQLTTGLGLILGMNWLCNHLVTLNCALGEATVRSGFVKASLEWPLKGR